MSKVNHKNVAVLVNVGKQSTSSVVASKLSYFRIIKRMCLYPNRKKNLHLITKCAEQRGPPKTEISVSKYACPHGVSRAQLRDEAKCLLVQLFEILHVAPLKNAHTS